jgi:SpoVK/Ycf46/Vps4 family AAA+-type ATPase
LTQRSSDESEASRRIKTEFLVQLDGAGGGGTSNRSAVSECGSDKEGSEYREDARVVVIGATNRPDELDEAARRRFAKRLYIPLPDTAGREQLVTRLLSTISHDMTESEQASVVVRTEGYSGADIKNLCTEASLGPVRDIAAMNVHFMDIKGECVSVCLCMCGTLLHRNL